MVFSIQCLSLKNYSEIHTFSWCLALPLHIHPYQGVILNIEIDQAVSLHEQVINSLNKYNKLDFNVIYTIILAE